MTIDEIGFGNPTFEYLKIINTQSGLDDLFTNLTSFTFPKNSSEATREELNHIVPRIEALKVDSERQALYKTYDRNLPLFYFRYLSQYGIPKDAIQKIIVELSEEVTPLLFKLKYFFQRPRPSQLAFYYKLRLMPFQSPSAATPSFPSGHAYYAKLFTEVAGNHYPEIYGELKRIEEDVCNSRIDMGLHFPSDIDAGIFAAENILNKREFKIKYHL